MAELLSDETLTRMKKGQSYPWDAQKAAAKELLLARAALREVRTGRAWVHVTTGWRWTERPGTRGMTVPLADPRPHLAAYLDALAAAPVPEEPTDG